VSKAANTNALPDLPAHPIPVEQVVIEIVGDPRNVGGRLVLQDGVESSYIDIAHPERLGFEYQRHLASVIDVMHPRRRALSAFQIGGGPCAVMRYLDATRRDLRALVAELDPGVIATAERYLGLVQGPRLRVEVGDGRMVMQRLPDASLDIVVVDAFMGLVVPHALVTSQFVVGARRVLRPEGVHIINLIDIPPNGYATAVVATLRAKYADVIVMADAAVIGGDSAGNFVIAASDRSIPAEIVARHSVRDDDPWQVLSGRPLVRWVGDAAPLDDSVEPDHELARLGDLFGRVRRPQPKDTA
jgi:spermidine synthase